MKVVFCFFIVLILFIYGGYPLSLYIANFFIKDKRKDRDYLPKISIFIPAYNEENVIADKINNCLELEYPFDSFEILVLTNGCTDKTEEIASSFVDSRLKVINFKEKVGKVAALNHAVPNSSGSILLFTDANAFYKKDAVKRMVRAFNNPKIAGVCGCLTYNDGTTEVSSDVETVYWKYENKIKELESTANTLVAANGSIYAIRREYYESIDEDLADDFVIPIRIAKARKKLIFEKKAEAYEKLPEKQIEEFSRRVRIINQGYRATIKNGKEIIQAGPLFVYEFLCHKVLRWLVPVFMILIFMSNIFLLNQSFYRYLFYLQAIFYMLALVGIFKGGKIRIKLIKVITYFCLLNAAALIGLFSFLFNIKYITWEKASSTR